MWGTTLVNGGTSVSIWGYLVVALLTLTIGSSLAESRGNRIRKYIKLTSIKVCSAFPTTGGLYFWTAQLSDSEWVPFMCWIVGMVLILYTYFFY